MKDAICVFFAKRGLLSFSTQRCYKYILVKGQTDYQLKIFLYFLAENPLV